MRSKQEIIAEIQRVSQHLGANRVSQTDFEKHGAISLNGVTYVFGSWNRAVTAAGLEVYKQHAHGKKKFSDKELMEEVIRLTRQLGKKPSDREMASFGRFSPKAFTDRWGTFAKGRTAAYEKMGYPEL